MSLSDSERFTIYDTKVETKIVEPVGTSTPDLYGFIAQWLELSVFRPSVGSNPTSVSRGDKSG